jgi:Leucine-rich repeat (LRR) protein
LATLDGLGTLTRLTTLAAAHNHLRALPTLQFAPDLQQLRLNDNRLVALGDALRGNARSASA